MSISREIYEAIIEVKKILSRKNFKRIFTLFLVTYLFFGVFNTYAQEETLVKPAWQETKKFHNWSSGLFDGKEDEDNMNSREGSEFLNGMWTVFSLVAPDLTEVKNASRDDLPYDLQRGLVGMVEDAGVTAYAVYPRISVTDHLAQQWVPGYKEGSIGIYARNNDSYESGYKSLQNSGIDGLWGRALNLAYVFFVLALIIAGFMIMFRHKLGGQTVVTIGNVLPRVVISVVLATFSFAIAGLVIDLAGIMNGIVKYLLALDSDKLSGTYGIVQLMSGIVGGDGTFLGTVKSLGETVLQFGLFGIWEEKSFLGIVNLTVKIISMFIPGAREATVMMGALGLFLVLIALGVILFGAIKLIIVLFKSWFMILMTVVLGPLQIMLGAIPGNDKMIKNWFTALLRHTMVFPVVLFIINLPNVFENEGLFGKDNNLVVNLPQKLVNNPGASGWLTKQVDVARLAEIFLRVFVVFIAAQAPKFLETIFPPVRADALTQGMATAKQSMSKVPLVGRIFKEKKR